MNGSSITFPQDQSGITNELWRSHLEQTTEQQRERRLITSDRQKNQPQDNLTGKECGGDSRKLAGRPQVAVPEGQLNNQLDLPEKCGV